MANEITISATINFAKNLVAQLMNAAGLQFNVTGVNYIKNVMQVPITAGGTAIPLGSVGTPGWAFFRNLDQVNFITIKPAAAGVDLVKLKPNEIAMFRLKAAAPAALADTAICALEYFIVED